MVFVPSSYSFDNGCFIRVVDCSIRVFQFLAVLPLKYALSLIPIEEISFLLALFIFYISQLDVFAASSSF